ncbi:hypothetical protein RJT34_00594 [Clitoria ternatea]|uniref:Uncharacterized protein n=1 Tax=Clitoria ternatea TaxID=43366 RepID=A0AAN9KFE6_CLITE
MFSTHLRDVRNPFRGNAKDWDVVKVMMHIPPIMAITIRESLFLALNHRIDKVVVESDNLDVVRAYKKKILPVSIFTVVQDVLSLNE